MSEENHLEPSSADDEAITPAAEDAASADAADPAPGAEDETAADPATAEDDGAEEGIDEELAGAFDSLFDGVTTSPPPSGGVIPPPGADADGASLPTPPRDTGATSANISEAAPAGMSEQASALDAASSASATADAVAPGAASAGAEASAEAGGGGWYVAIDDEMTGPLSEPELGERWDKGEINQNSLAWRQGQADWLPIRDIFDLHGFVSERSGRLRRPSLAELDRDTGDLPSPPGGESGDPFATVEVHDGADAPVQVSDTWRPDGMTDVYQAAAAAERGMANLDALDSAQADGDSLNDGHAAAALASLAAEEAADAERSRKKPDLIPVADDRDLRTDDSPSAVGVSGLAMPWDSPGEEGDVPDPFAAGPMDASGPDIGVVQLGGQSSLIARRPDDIYEADKKRNWPLIGGIAGGAVVLTLLVVVLVLALSPPKTDDADAKADGNKVVQPVDSDGESVGTKDPTAPNGDSANKGTEIADQEKPKVKQGNCDPILYPNGICPGDDKEVKAVERKDELTKDDILATVQSNQAAIDSCIAEHVKRMPRLAEGTVKVQWYVRSDGRTKSIAVLTPKFKETYVGTCLSEQIAGWRFPAFKGDEVGPIRFPFSID